MLSTKEEIINVLYYVGQADRVQITNLISKEFNANGIGKREKSVENNLKQLKDESYTLTKTNRGKTILEKKQNATIEFDKPFGNKKEIYTLSNKTLQSLGVYTKKRINVIKTSKIIDYICEIKKDIMKNNEIISLEELFTSHIIPLFNTQLKYDIEEEIQCFDLYYKKDGKEYVLIYVNSDKQSVLNKLIKVYKSTFETKRNFVVVFLLENNKYQNIKEQAIKEAKEFMKEFVKKSNEKKQ